VHALSASPRFWLACASKRYASGECPAKLTSAKSDGFIVRVRFKQNATGIRRSLRILAMTGNAHRAEGDRTHPSQFPAFGADGSHVLPSLAGKAARNEFI
jgi:hypothetical protein